MTGLLAVDDEVLEVNSIEVTGKTLDQVRSTGHSCHIFILFPPLGDGYDGCKLCQFDNNSQARQSKEQHFEKL